MHPVPQGLTVHAAGFGRRFAVHAIEHQRKRKYPTRRGTILLSARRLAKLRSRQIKPGDRYRRSHRCRSSQRPASSQSFTDLGIPNESQFRAVGIRYPWAASPAHARGTVPSHLPGSYDFAFTGLRSVTAAVSWKSEIESVGADAGSDARPVAQSWPRLSTSIESTSSFSSAVTS